MKTADSNVEGFTAKAEPGTDRYKESVAEPVMGAVDAMPKEYRALVHDLGYVDVYRAWRRGLSASKIREMAQSAGGVFHLE